MRRKAMISLGQAHETEVTLQTAGATTEFWTRLAQNLELAKATVAFVMRMVFQLVAKIDRNMEGWECIEPVDAEEGEFEPSLHGFVEQGENYVKCEEMLKRAKEKGISSGLRHLEAMLRNQERIPVEWRKHIIVSTEVWRGPGDNRCVFYLYWGGECWYLGYDWLDFDFDSGSRLVGFRK